VILRPKDHESIAKGLPSKANLLDFTFAQMLARQPMTEIEDEDEFEDDHD
jgi:hypothetical protein